MQPHKHNHPCNSGIRVQRSAQSGQQGVLTLFILMLRRSEEFLTKGDFLDSVELSLSLRFIWKRMEKQTKKRFIRAQITSSDH